ncbi:MAG: hypothetical protein O3A14_20330 [Cyanobacteria bacterium]|nr:hypothetical protein [Cyanobacteriota bacterium]
MSNFRQGWLPFIEQALRRRFATAAQGALAESAAQPSDLVGFATSSQGAKADTALQPGDRYQILANRTLEWDNVAVSASGQNYQLSSIPQAGNYLVHCFLNPGYSGNGGLTIIFARPSQQTKPTPSTDPFSGTRNFDSIGFSNGSTYNFVATGHIWIPAENGQIWARRGGTYFSAGSQSVLYTLGCIRI